MGNKHKILEIGSKFERLTITSHAGVDKRNRTLYNAVCDCGNIAICNATELRNGHKKSCGCLRSELSSKRMTTHGATKGGKSSKEFTTWCSIKQRCLDENTKSYHNYGGRGISICERWVNSFENFLFDMGKRPSSKHSIDRIDVNGNYEPSNCRWATSKEQGRNRRNNRIVNINGSDKSLVEASEIIGIKQGTLISRLNRGHQNPLNKEVISYPSKEVINIETGLFYDSINEAAKAHNIKPITLHKRLSRGYNKFTNLQHAI